VTVLLSYARFEVVRALRSPRFLLLVAAVPLLLYVVGVHNLQGPGSTATNAGVPATIYYLASASVLGTLGAALTGANARLAAERASGWYRQLRVTPLGDSRWLAGRLLASLVVVLPAVLVVSVAALTYGSVRLGVSNWAALVMVLLLGAIPIALIGLILGLVLRAESSQAAQSLVFIALAFIGGAFADTTTPPSGTRALVELTPSYHINVLAHQAVQGQAPGVSHLAAIIAFTLALGAAAILLRRRTT
jgi:ABC-2 type transport system permease protein